MSNEIITKQEFRESIKEVLNKQKGLTNSEDCDSIKKIKRRIVDWIFKTAKDEELYEIAWSHNIKTD